MDFLLSQTVRNQRSISSTESFGAALRPVLQRMRHCLMNALQSFHWKAWSSVTWIKNNQKPQTRPANQKKTSHKSIHKPQTDSSEFAPKLMFIPNLLCCFGTKSQNVLHLFHSQHSGDLSCTCWGRLGFLSPG